MEVQRRNNFVVGSNNTEIISWGVVFVGIMVE